MPQVCDESAQGRPCLLRTLSEVFRCRKSGLPRAKAEKAAHGESKTEHRGYLGAQETYCVGTLKGVGRIYQ